MGDATPEAELKVLSGAVDSITYELARNRNEIHRKMAAKKTSFLCLVNSHLCYGVPAKLSQRNHLVEDRTKRIPEVIRG